MLRDEMAQTILQSFLDGMERLGITREEAIQMIKKKEG